MFRKRSFIGLFLFLPFLYDSILVGFGNNLIISSIQFTGNKKTQDYIIEREIQHPIQSLFDSTLANRDLDRLENLSLFSEVEWKIIPIEDSTAILQYFITESLQKLPPFALPVYDEEQGWSIVGALVFTNFRGRNQFLSLGGSFGGEDSYGMTFQDPWIFGNHVSFEMTIENQKFPHLFLERESQVKNFQIKFGRWFGEKIKMTIGNSFVQKRYLGDVDTLSYNFISPEFSFSYDSRDIFWNPSSGKEFNHNFLSELDHKSKSKSSLVWRQSYSSYYKLNSSIKSLIFAINLTINKRWGYRNIVFLNYFGGSRSIRGWAIPNTSSHSPLKESFRYGHDFIQFSSELRKEIIPKFATRFDIETGLIIVSFFDIGVISDKIKSFGKEGTMAGAGLGIRVPIPIFEVIRLDLGWGYRKGSWGKPGLHFWFGQKF